MRATAGRHCELGLTLHSHPMSSSGLNTIRARSSTGGICQSSIEVGGAMLGVSQTP